MDRGARPPSGTRRRCSSSSTQNTVTPQFKALVPVATRPIFGAEPRELSLLFVLFYIAASGNEQNVGTFERNFNTRDGAQMFRFAGGSQRICKTARAQARALGGARVAGAPDRPASAAGSPSHSDRVEVRAKRVIVAVPPMLTGKIDYEPGLPDERVELIDHYPQGTLTKAACVYDRPFWRDDGLTGQVLSTDGPIAATFDDSPEDGSKGDRLRLHRRRRRARLREARRRRQRRAGGDRRLRQLLRPRRRRTRARTSRRPGSARPGPGAARSGSPASARSRPAARQLAKPVGRIHWAGTETSNYWAGYMDGAVRSGERAAAEVLERL